MFFKSCRFAGIALVVCLAVSVTKFQSVASAQVSEEKLAHIVFDVRVDKALEYLESVGMESETFFGPGPDGEVIKSIERVYGAVQLPADMEAGMALLEIMELVPNSEPEMKAPYILDKEDLDKGDYDKGDYDGDKKSDDGSLVSLNSGPATQEEVDLPVNFFFRMQFKTAEAAQQYIEESLGTTEERVINGETFLAPQARMGAPTNLLFHIVDGTTFEAGTTDYLTQPSRKLFTERLNATWQGMPSDAIRLAVDLESVSPFVDGLMEMARENAPPPVIGMLELIPKISVIKFGADFQGANLLTLSLSGKDEQQSEELRSGIDGLLGFAKLMGGQAVQEIGRESPAAGKIVGEVLSSLKATRTDNEVTIAIARPDGFDEAMKAAMVDARAQAEGVMELNRFRQVGLSMHIYHDVHNKFPSSESSTSLSWRALVCPYLESNLEFDENRPFDDPTNAAHADKMPKDFGSDGKTSTVCRISNDGFPKTFNDITDGTSNTIMLLENPAGVPWLEPNDLSIDEAVKLVTGLKGDETLIAAMYDGSAHRLRSGLTAEQIRPFFTFNGGEEVDYDVLYP